jgi:hemoglobin
MKKERHSASMSDVRQRPSGDENCRTDLAFDLAFPSIPCPSPTAFAGAGEAALRALVRCHHERLRNSSIGHLFPADPSRFAAVVERIADFVADTTIGAGRSTQSQVYTWLRAQHFPITIDETARNVWLAKLLLAFDDIGFPDEARREYWNWVEALSILVINRRTMITQPRRYPLADAAVALSPFMGAG